MPNASFRPAGRRERPAVRLYVVLALGAAAPCTAFARPLGTVTAPTRALAREAARVLFPSVAADELRVVAAGVARAGLLAGALAADYAGPADGG